MRRLQLFICLAEILCLTTSATSAAPAELREQKKGLMRKHPTGQVRVKVQEVR